MEDFFFCCCRCVWAFFNACRTVLLTVPQRELVAKINVMEECEKNNKKNKTKSLVGKGERGCRVSEKKNSACWGQQIQSKDRLVCLRAVHSQPTLSSGPLLPFSYGFLWGETEKERGVCCGNVVGGQESCTASLNKCQRNRIKRAANLPATTDTDEKTLTEEKHVSNTNILAVALKN